MQKSISVVVWTRCLEYYNIFAMHYFCERLYSLTIYFYIMQAHVIYNKMTHMTSNVMHSNTRLFIATKSFYLCTWNQIHPILLNVLVLYKSYKWESTKEYIFTLLVLKRVYFSLQRSVPCSCDRKVM